MRVQQSKRKFTSNQSGVASVARISAPMKSTTSSYSVPWVEKYRPLTLDQVVGNEDTIQRLQAIAEDGNMPNLILCGPPGTGKVRKLERSTRIFFY